MFCSSISLILNKWLFIFFSLKSRKNLPSAESLPKCLKHEGRSRPKPGSLKSNQVSHTGGGDQALELSTAASQHVFAGRWNQKWYSSICTSILAKDAVPRRQLNLLCHSIHPSFIVFNKWLDGSRLTRSANNPQLQRRTNVFQITFKKIYLIEIMW